MINVALAREIYNQPWLMDSESFGSLFGMLVSFRSGAKFEATEQKLNSTTFYDLKSVDFVKDSYDLRKADQEAELVNIININGPITKNGGASSYGTKQMSNQMLRADKDNRVKGHIIIPDTGGGASNAIQFMTDAVKQSTKPVVTFIEKGSITGSAGYAIISPSNYIIAERNNVRVGSIGTYIEFGGFPKEAELDNGMKYVRIYASKSIEKNLEFEEAINNNNYTPTIENILDPVNEEFLDMVVSNRPNATKKQLRGGMFNAGDVIGSLVDEIGSFQLAVDKVLELSTIQESKNSNINNSSMNKQEIKQKYPETYNEIFQDGVQQGTSTEKDRVGAWMQHVETDPKEVATGIESGEEITATQRETFFVKKNSKDIAGKMKEESAGDLNTPESKTEEQKNKEALEKETEEAFNFELN